MWLKLCVCAILAVPVVCVYITWFPTDIVKKDAGSPTERILFHHVKVDTIPVVKLYNKIVDPQDAIRYSKQYHGFIRKLGENNTKVILSVDNSKLEPFQHASSVIFLKAAALENAFRDCHDQKPITIFLHIPVKSFNDGNDTSELIDLAVVLLKYIRYDVIVSGLIVETSLIQTRINAEGGAYGNKITMDVGSSIGKFKKFLNVLQLKFGPEMKMGLLLNSYEECLEENVGQAISSFDMVVLNKSFMDYAGKSFHGYEEQETAYPDNCVTRFQKTVPELEFCQIGGIWYLKN